MSSFATPMYLEASLYVATSASSGSAVPTTRSALEIALRYCLILIQRRNHYDPQGVFRGWGLNLNGWNGYSFGGERLGTGLNVNGGGTFRSNWGLWFGGDHEFPALRTDLLRGGPAVAAPAQTSFNVTLISDDRKVVSGNAYVFGWREWESSGGGWSAGAFATVRPSGRFRPSLGPDVSRGLDALAYVATAMEGESAAAPHYVLASLDQTTVSLTTRLDYAFTPRLTLEFYAQPFVATGRYTPSGKW